jgi:hypothetical protein
MSSILPATPRPRAPMRGLRQLRAALSADSLQCCISRQSCRRWMRYERRSCKKVEPRNELAISEAQCRLRPDWHRPGDYHHPGDCHHRRLRLGDISRSTPKDESRFWTRVGLQHECAKGHFLHQASHEVGQVKLGHYPMGSAHGVRGYRQRRHASYPRKASGSGPFARHSLRRRGSVSLSEATGKQPRAFQYDRARTVFFDR